MFNFDTVEKGNNMFTEITVGEKILFISEQASQRKKVKVRDETSELALWRDPALHASGESRQIEPF